MKKKIDMTKGPIMWNIVLFALPIIAGNILQYLYTTVDTLVIGNFCDHTAIAAVGTSSQPIEVLLCIFLGIGSGVSVLVSQHAGAKDAQGLKDSCKSAVTLVYMAGIPVTILGWFAAPLILRVMEVPADVWDNALLYTRIVICSATANIGYNMNAGILRGIGDSRASLLFLIVSCIANVVLDVVLVAFYSFGVPGVAFATAFAMYMSWICSIIYIRKHYPELELTILPRGFVRDETRKILAIGLPIGLNNSLFSLGHVAMQSLVNAQGSIFMAGWSVSGRVSGLSNMAITGFSSAASTFSGQNYGAHNLERLRRGQYKIPFAAGGVTLAAALFFVSFRTPILRLFTDQAEVIDYSSRIVIVMMLGQWMYAVFSCISNIVNGTGRVRYTTLINLCMLWVVRIPSAYLIARFIDGNYIMYALPISFFFGMTAMLGYYLLSKSWKQLFATAVLETAG